MNILFANIPFIKHDTNGNIYTGPNAGSRWPWTEPGITAYACFPFFMGYAVSYLHAHGVAADFYDGVALKHWDYDTVRAAVARYKPDLLFLETSTPLYRTIREFAIWVKANFNSRIVLTGPHIQTYARELIAEEFVDHCIVGEYEMPALDVARRGAAAEKIYTYDHLDDINQVKGENFLPFRPLDYLYNYLDPSMDTGRPQLAVSTSRGCPFKCTYCQWPKVMNNGQYRNRAPEMVIDEIRTVIAQYDARQLSLAGRVQGGLNSLRAVKWKKQPAAKGLSNALQGTDGGVQSIFFDDDTWNLGQKRITDLCRGLKDIGLPWTMMGRIDTSSLEVYDLLVDSGCVGMRFGIESFNQRLLDNTKKNLSADKSLANVKYLISRFSGLEFHFTTMKNLPGETAADWENDERLLKELKDLGARSGNRVHWQNSDCIAFPGTELWEEMVAQGKGEQLRNFDLFDGNPRNTDKLAEMVGWLGADYAPKYSKYSKMGAPTNFPKE